MSIKPIIPDGEEYKRFPVSALDIETRRDGSLLAGALAFYVGDDITIERFLDWPTLIKYLMCHSRKNKALRTIYAHNGAGFDWLSLIGEKIKNPDLFEGIKYAQDNNGQGIGITIKLKGKHGTIHLRDSMRLLPSSLKSLTADFGVTQKLSDVDASNIEDLYNSDPSHFWRYLETDALSLLEVIDKFHQMLWDIAPIQKIPITSGSTSMLAWRYFLNDVILVPWGKDLKEFSRRSYYGGRVQHFLQGVFNVKTYDVNSMYPSVMSAYRYPASYRGYWTKYYRPGGLFEVSYNQPDKSVPPLLRDEESFKYSYSGRGVFWSWDLEKLTSLGGVYSIDRGYVFMEWDYLFKEYQTRLYDLRMKFKQSGNKGGERVVKLLANSLYGKFGQRPTGKEVCRLDGVELQTALKDGKKITHIREDWYTVEYPIKIHHEFSAIASAVTSRSRLKLYQYFEAVGFGLVYCDTDSVHVLEEYSDKLEPYVGKELGALKLEKTGLGAYVQKKLYAIRDISGVDTVVSKGVPPSKLSFDLLAGLASGEVGSILVEYESPTTPTEVFHGAPPCVWVPRHRTITLNDVLTA